MRKEMLLTKRLKIKWLPQNKNYFESIGYEFTKFNDEFEVDVNELGSGSSQKVTVKCDYCDCIKHMKRTKDENGNLVYVEIPYRNRDWLYNEYITKDRDAKDIAKECGINMRTLREWISMLNLPYKPSKSEGL